MELNCYLLETPWETRNLGIPSFIIEQRFYETADFDGLQEQIIQLHKKHGNFFIYTRIGKHHLHYASQLEHIGLYFIETTIISYINLRKNLVLKQFCNDQRSFIPRKYKQAHINFRTLSRDAPLPVNDLQSIAVESFTDDRFHLDHNCPTKYANLRFSYWIDDLISEENVVFDIVEMKDTLIGFLARRENELILSGFAKSFHRAGLGKYLVLSTCEKLSRDGYVTAEARISVNNLLVLNLLCRLGFKFKHPEHTFHYWSGKKLTIHRE